jgi:hypothetical protein
MDELYSNSGKPIQDKRYTQIAAFGGSDADHHLMGMIRVGFTPGWTGFFDIKL